MYKSKITAVVQDQTIDILTPVIDVERLSKDIMFSKRERGIFMCDIPLDGGGYATICFKFDNNSLKEVDIQDVYLKHVGFIADAYDCTYDMHVFGSSNVKALFDDTEVFVESED